MSSKARKVRVLDGSFASELSKVVPGFFEQECPNWTFDAVIHQSEAVVMVHKRNMHNDPELHANYCLSFIDAGVDDITTNTYHASLPLLQEQGLDGRVLIKKAVDLLKELLPTYHAKEGRRIWAALGSYAINFRGQAAEYTGSYVDSLPSDKILAAMTDFHAEQIKAVIEAGLTNILFETVSSLLEGKAISEALSMSLCNDIKAVVSFTCKKDGTTLRHGEKFADAVQLVLTNSKVVGFGINCTDPTAVTPLLESVQSFLPVNEVFVYPNGGEHEQSASEKNGLDVILMSAEKWIQLGATVIGGCCGINADGISQIRKRVDRLQQSAE